MLLYLCCIFLLSSSCLFFFFFLQAQDGILDSSVTGVQTCALPIYDPTSCCGPPDSNDLGNPVRPGGPQQLVGSFGGCHQCGEKKPRSSDWAGLGRGAWGKCKQIGRAARREGRDGAGGVRRVKAM